MSECKLEQMASFISTKVLSKYSEIKQANMLSIICEEVSIESIKAVLELPEFREAVEALKFYRQYSDCVEDCRSRSDSWVLKSDYDALTQLSDAFYLKQVQLENQNEELKYQLVDRSEKYKIAMDKAVEALKVISQYTSAYSGASSPEANLAKETLRELGVEFEA